MDYSAYVDRDVLNSYIEMPVGSYNLCGVMLKDFSNLDQKTVLINSLLKGKCGVCEYSRICGGSRARAYAMTGDIHAEEPFCAHVPARYGRMPATSA